VVAQLVHVVQCAGDAGDDGQRHWMRQRTPPMRPHQRQQVVPVHELHRDEVLALELAEVEHLRDVGVVQSRGEPRLVEEHPREFGIVGELRQDALERHQLVEALGPAQLRQIHLGHAAGGDAPHQRIPSDARTRR
jgi:hypothetical protein